MATILWHTAAKRCQRGKLIIIIIISISVSFVVIDLSCAQLDMDFFNRLKFYLIQNVKHLFVPAERKIPKVRIETRQSETLSSQRIIVAIDSWPRNSRYPSGHFVRALGKVGDKDTENEVLLLEHDVPHSRFSDAVLSFLPKLPWIITEEVSIFYFTFQFIKASSWFIFSVTLISTLEIIRIYFRSSIDQFVYLNKLPA